MLDLRQLDWIAILVSTRVSGGIGANWCSSSLFGTAWMHEFGMNEEDLGPGSAIRTSGPNR